MGLAPEHVVGLVATHVTANATRRRALELLPASRDGCTEASLLARGFKIEMLADMIRAVLATAGIERMMAGSRPIEVVRVRITESGRRALAESDGPNR